MKNTSILIIVISSFHCVTPSPFISISPSLPVLCLTHKLAHTSAVTFHTVGETAGESNGAKKKKLETIHPTVQTHALIVTDSLNHFPVRSGDVPFCCCCCCRVGRGAQKSRSRTGGLTPQCPGCSSVCSTRLHAASAKQFSQKNVKKKMLLMKKKP